MYMLDINDILTEPFDDNGPEPADMCGCSDCGWKGKCSDCETEWEQDGYENPSYQIHLCPMCIDGGCIDDYWHSDKEE